LPQLSDNQKLTLASLMLLKEQKELFLKTLLWVNLVLLDKVNGIKIDQAIWVHNNNSLIHKQFTNHNNKSNNKDGEFKIKSQTLEYQLDH